MKKLFLFVIVLFLLFPILHPSYAQTVTPTSEVVAPDSTNARINLTQSLTGFLQQLLNFHWDITINPADNKYPAAKNLPDLGQQLQQSGEQDLMPAELQVSVTPDLQPKQQTIASVQCITNPQTGKLEQFPSKDRITTKEIPGLKELTTGSRELGSYVTGYTQTSQNYNDLKMVIVSTDNTCDTAQTTGQKVDKIDVDTQNQNSYTGTQSNVIISTLNTVLAAIEGALKKYVVTEHNEIQEKSVTPWIHIPACLFSSCQASDVASVTYDPNKTQYVQSGGLVDSMYLSDGLKYTDAFNAAVDSNWSISGNIDATSNVQGAQNVPATAYNFGQAAIANAGTYMNCTLTPAGIQGSDCDKNWAKTAAGSTTVGGWNCDTSVPAQTVPGVNLPNAQSFVTRWYNSCPNASANAWQKCANDVIATAKKSCVDPLFALAIWIHESGASNYQCSELVLNGQKVEDFGIHNSLYPPENFRVQLDKFVQLPSAYVGNCPQLTLQNFLARFGPGVFTPSGHYQCYGELSQANKNIVDTYINELKLIYAGIAPGISLPTWPGSSGCTGN